MLNGLNLWSLVISQTKTKEMKHYIIFFLLLCLAACNSIEPEAKTTFELKESKLTSKTEKSSNSPNEQVKALNNLLRFYYDEGNFPAAQPTIDKLEALIQNSDKVSKRLQVDGHLNLSEFYLDIQQPEKAKSHLQQAQTIARKIYDKNGINYAKLQIVAANNLLKEGNLKESGTELNAAILKLQKMDNNNMVEAKCPLGIGHIRNAQLKIKENNPPKAEEYLKIAFRVLQSCEQKKYLGMASVEMGNALLRQGKNQDAVKFIKQGLEIYKQINHEKHPNYALALSYMGMIYFRAGQMNEAEESFLDAEKIMIQNFGENHEYTNSTKQVLQQFYENRDKVKKSPQ